VANEQNYIIFELWDGEHLRVNFIRHFDHRFMLQWYEILQILQTLQPTAENDALRWKFEPNGFFSVKSMYAIINYRGIMPVHVHLVWKT
jgi:hypothetical protein